MDMFLTSDDWDLVSRQSWLEKFWQQFARFVNFRVVFAIVLLVLLLYADMPETPAIVTDDLSFEIVKKVRETTNLCSDESKETGDTSCPIEVWKTCHTAKRELDKLLRTPRLGEESALRNLCDTAVVADARELARALASRYGERYYRQGWFKTTETDKGKASFLWFQDLVDFMLYSLREDLEDSECITCDFIISYWRELYGRLGLSSYRHMNDDTDKILLTLQHTIADFFEPFLGFGSDYVPYELANIMRENHNLNAVGNNLWQEPSSPMYVKGAPEQNCISARLAVRESQHDWERLLNSCRRLADSCVERADSFSVSCSLAKGAAEFESMWQNLPEACAQADEKAEEPTIDEEPNSDACYQAALAICQYPNVSPEDEWLDQLISMRDFACAAASRTPDLLYVKVDDRAPEYQP